MYCFVRVSWIMKNVWREPGRRERAREKAGPKKAEEEVGKKVSE